MIQSQTEDNMSVTVQPQDNMSGTVSTEDDECYCTQLRII